jgi:DNA-binding IclR family transcriptional regulator
LRNCFAHEKRLPTKPNNSDADKSRIQTYGKMMEVLGCFSTIDRQLSLAQVADTTQLPRATVHRILSALKEIGFIEQDSRGGSYGLGIRLFELGSLALANMELHREAKPFVDRLSRISGESVHLGVFNGHEMVVIEREDHTDRLATPASAIESAPAHCTGVGKAVLAFLDKPVLARVVKAGLKSFTKKTITSPAALDRELARIRRQGYAVDDGEHQLWVRCVAAPIRNASGRVFAAISATGPANRITPERTAALSGPVVQAANSISRHLGYQPKQ